MIESHSTTSQRRNGPHTTHYLAAGPENGPLLIFVHGWPELSLSWRHQLPLFASLGFRAVAPDMRGYGQSTVYDQHADYAQREVVADMLDLLDALGRESAIWVGHDWGAPTVWSIAANHPECCAAVANLCVPYRTLELGLDACLPLADRTVYPERTYPAAQWEYQLYYAESFDRATAVFDAYPERLVRLLFRKGDPAGAGQPAGTARTRIDGGWFGGTDEVPDLPFDQDVVTAEDVATYTEHLSRNGFFGPNSYYMNHDANAQFNAHPHNDGFLQMPVLFLHGAYDYTCETLVSNLAQPMRDYIAPDLLTERIVPSGHWMAQERPIEVNNALVRWLVEACPSYWPTHG